MPDARTTITELVTGLGTLGHRDLDAALVARPAEMVSVAPQLWDDLVRWSQAPSWRQAFAAAYANGEAFLFARDGLRGRVPLTVEWRGSAKPIDDELVPADLRIDQVFLVSCKYLSKVVGNFAPGRVFDGLLRTRAPSERRSWFEAIAPDEHGALLRAACDHADIPRVTAVGDLADTDRDVLRSALQGRKWPDPCEGLWLELAATVAERTADRWRSAIGSADDALRLLLRMLRIGATPYFVLGVGDHGVLRFRVLTSWDWRSRYRLESLEVRPKPGGQPLVTWEAAVHDRDVGRVVVVEGHVEVRWKPRTVQGSARGQGVPRHAACRGAGLLGARARDRGRAAGCRHPLTTSTEWVSP